MNPNNLRLNLNASTLDVPISGILHQSATSAIEYGCHENVAEDVHGECTLSLDFDECRESLSVEPERRGGRRSLHLELTIPEHRYPRAIDSPSSPVTCSPTTCSPSTCSPSCSSTSPMSNLMDHSPCSSCSSIGSSVSDDLPLLSVLLGISQSEEDIAVSTNGYKIDREIKRILQGTILKAHITSATDQNRTFGPVGSAVTIKRVEKAVYAAKTANDEDGFSYVIEQDIVKEAILLKHLTQHNRPTGDYIARFVDFFESDAFFYLVTEHVEGISLGQFVEDAFSLMTQGRLSRIDYQKTVKYLFWQMVTTMRWLHDVCHTCHLDLNPTNVMLRNATFEAEYEGSMRLKPSAAISIKLLDFGVAERFDYSTSTAKDQQQRPSAAPKVDFTCDKGTFLTSAPQFRCPDMFDGFSYSAKAADCWSLGMMLFEMLTGEELYAAEDLWDYNTGGFAALKNNRLRECLTQRGLFRCFKRDTLNIVEGLLRVDEDQRLSADDVIGHPWFRSYYERYNASMQKKNAIDALRLERHAGQLKRTVPCYQRLYLPGQL